MNGFENLLWSFIEIRAYRIGSDRLERQGRSCPCKIGDKATKDQKNNLHYHNRSFVSIKIVG